MATYTAPIRAVACQHGELALTDASALEISRLLLLRSLLFDAG